MFVIITAEILCPYKNSGLIENFSCRKFPAIQYSTCTCGMVNMNPGTHVHCVWVFYNDTYYCLSFFLYFSKHWHHHYPGLSCCFRFPWWGNIHTLPCYGMWASDTWLCRCYIIACLLASCSDYHGDSLCHSGMCSLATSGIHCSWASAGDCLWPVSINVTFLYMCHPNI